MNELFVDVLPSTSSDESFEKEGYLVVSIEIPLVYIISSMIIIL
jgi:hypothetical protein